MRSILLRNRLYCRLLTALLLSLTCLYSSAQASDHRVTINGSGIPLKAVFKAIKKQTGFAVMYNTSITMLNQEEKVTVSFKDTPLDEVLSFLLKGRSLSWTYNDDVVVIYKKLEEVPKKNELAADSTVTPALLNGKVTDAAGSPLPGVTVQVKGASQGTTTDADGKFTLAKVKNGDVLVISSIGYETRALEVKGRSILAQLNVLVSGLDETIVMAYGTTTQRLSTSNISTVKAKDIEKQPVNNPLLALQGRVPGVFITQATGVPGSGVTVRIQGRNSLERGSDPLYVIDGVPYTAQLLPNISGVFGILGSSGNTNTYDQAGGGNPLSFINPADIESIDILKDADATAIYGSRAANGAILITTKKGKIGQTKVGITFQSGWGKVTRKLNLLNTHQYLEMRHEALKNDGTVPGPTDYDVNGTWDTTSYTDWQKKLIGGTAHYTDAQASVSGGNNNTRFLIGAGYHRETTVFPSDLSDQKISVHFNISNSSSDQKFRIQLSGNYLTDDNKLVRTDLTEAAIRLAPNAPSLYSIDGSLNWAPLPDGNATWKNPLAFLYNKYRHKANNLISNALISYEILPNLEIKSSFGYTRLETNEISTFPLLSYAPETWPNTTRLSQFGNSTISSWIIEPQATFKRSIKKGTLEVLIGTTILQNNRNGQQFRATGFNNDQVMEDIRAAPLSSVRQNIISKYRYNALFGRINYNWQDKYILNLTARRDGSSRFGDENLFHNFGAIAGAWIFSNENLIRKKIIPLSFGKLRASYGITGSDQIGDYQFMSLYNTLSVPVAYQGASALSPAGLPNPHLQWEETRKLQFGLDLGLLKDRILLNFNYYRNRSSNQLQGYALPIMTGNTSIQVNFPATIQNTGWEFSLHTTNLESRNFNWSSSFNLTLPQNKLISYEELSTSTYADYYVIGQPINLIKAFHFVGVDPATGLYQVADRQGKPTSSPDFSNDRIVLISTDPKYYGGFQNTFRYKRLELNLLFQFVKQTGVNQAFGFYPGFFYSDATNNYGNQPSFVLERWQKQDDKTAIQKYSSTLSGDITRPYDAAQFSDAGYNSDASYIRLKNLSLSWQLPEMWMKRNRIQQCKLFIQGQNLLTLTRYKGLDPENTTTNNLPPLKVLTFGVQLEL